MKYDSSKAVENGATCISAIKFKITFTCDSERNSSVSHLNIDLDEWYRNIDILKKTCLIELASVDLPLRSHSCLSESVGNKSLTRIIIPANIGNNPNDKTYSQETP